MSFSAWLTGDSGYRRGARDLFMDKPIRLFDDDLLPGSRMPDRKRAKSDLLFSEAKADAEGQMKKDRPDCSHVDLARKKALKAAKLNPMNSEALLLAAKLSVVLGDNETDPLLKEKEYEIANRCLVLAPMSLGEVKDRDPLALADIFISLHDLKMKLGDAEGAEGSLWVAFHHILEGIIERRGRTDANGNIRAEFHLISDGKNGREGVQDKLLALLPQIRANFQRIFMLDKPLDLEEIAKQALNKRLNGNGRHLEILMQHAKENRSIRLENRVYFPELAIRGLNEALANGGNNPRLHVFLGEVLLLQNKPEKAFFAYLEASMLLAKTDGKLKEGFDILDSPHMQRLLACVLECDPAVASSREPIRNAQQICRGWAKYKSGQSSHDANLIFGARVIFGDVIASVPKSMLANIWFEEFKHIGGDTDAHHVFNSKESAYI